MGEGQGDRGTKGRRGEAVAILIRAVGFSNLPLSHSPHVLPLPMSPSTTLPATHLAMIWLSLKIGRMMLAAINPTMPPMSRIMAGSIRDVTVLMTDLSSRV